MIWKAAPTFDHNYPKTSNVLRHNRTQKQLQNFFFLQKYYQLSNLGTLDMSGHFQQKW